MPLTGFARFTMKNKMKTMDKTTLNGIMADALYFLSIWIKDTDLSNGEWITGVWEGPDTRTAILSRWKMLMKHHGTASAITTLITELEEPWRVSLVSYLRKQTLCSQ